MRKILFILILFITSCGYQPIYLNSNLKNFEFANISLKGEKDVNRNIINTISLKEDKSNKSLNELSIESNYKVQETSKNKKGQINSYRSSIYVSLTIKKGQDIIKNKSFSKEFVYNNKDNKFELVEYQADIKIDLINKIIEDIILFLNL